MTVTFNYTTPKNKFGGDSAGGKTLQWLSRDWTFGGVLRYQSGVLLETPSANNNFLYQLGVGSQDNPAVFSAPEGIGKLRSGAAVLLGESELALRPDQNAGAESQGVDGTGSGPVRRLGSLLHQQPVAAAAG